MNAAEMVRRLCLARTLLEDFFNILLERNWFRALRVMRMIGPDIDAEFARHAIAERGFRKHALNRHCQELRRVFPKDVRG